MEKFPKNILKITLKSTLLQDFEILKNICKLFKSNWESRLEKKKIL